VGLRIGGGSPRSYYLLVEADGAHKSAVCALPRGAEEGEEIVLRGRTFLLRIGKPVRFRVRIDGRAPGADAGGDIQADGSGAVTEERLYQLVRQRGQVTDRTFEIEFLDPGVRAFAFTFG
jgi:hypothetical protein